MKVPTKPIEAAPILAELAANTVAAGSLEERALRRNAEREAVRYIAQAENFAGKAERARPSGDVLRIPITTAGEARERSRV